MNPRLTYREAAVRGASPVRLVILLYEQAIEDVRRALGACGRGDIEERTRGINHAILVIDHLQATLDKNQGGAVALNLERFYEQVRRALVEAQLKQSALLLEQQVAHLLMVRESWCELERRERGPAAATTPVPTPAENESHTFADWKA